MVIENNFVCTLNGEVFLNIIVMVRRTERTEEGFVNSGRNFS